MEKFEEIRDRFLELLDYRGEESIHGWDEVIFGYAKGRRVTTVRLVAAGDWAEENNIQVEIFAAVAKNKLQQLQQAKKKPTVYVMLTIDDAVVRCSIPNDVSESYAYREDGSGERSSEDETFCAASAAEVRRYYLDGSLVVAKE